jgi:hypothetical protein
MQIKATTRYLSDTSFSQEVTVEEKNGTLILTVMKFIVETRDKQLREALIGLGWTPPREV